MDGSGAHPAGRHPAVAGNHARHAPVAPRQGQRGAPLCSRPAPHLRLCQRAEPGVDGAAGKRAGRDAQPRPPHARTRTAPAIRSWSKSGTTAPAFRPRFRNASSSPSSPPSRRAAASVSVSTPRSASCAGIAASFTSRRSRMQPASRCACPLSRCALTERERNPRARPCAGSPAASQEWPAPRPTECPAAHPARIPSRAS